MFNFTFEENPNFPLALTCPKCGHQQAETLGRLRNEPSYTCGGCGITVEVGLDQLDGALKALKGASN